MTKPPAADKAPQLVSARDIALRYLRERIYSGALKPGDRVEVQNLASTLRISRTPVREAAWQLASEGLVDIQARVGFFVRHIAASEVLDIYDIRLMLEPLMAASAALRATEPERDAFYGSLAQLRAAHRRQRVRDYVLIIEQRRQALLEMSRHRALIDTLQGLDGRIRLLRIRNLSQPEALNVSLDQHTAIATAIAESDPSAAFSAMLEHMTYARNRMRSLLTSTADGPGPEEQTYSALDFVIGREPAPTAQPSTTAHLLSTFLPAK